MTKKTFTNTESRIRIDFFLSQKIKNLSRSTIQKLTKEGQLSINGKLCKKKSQVLEVGDKVQIQIPGNEKVIPDKKAKLNIILEDKNLLIINKPARLLVHPTNIEKQNTIANIILHKFPKINFGEKNRLGIVHRIDKDTSGILVIPKLKKVYLELQKLFKDRKVNKTYIAIVYGKPKLGNHTMKTRQKRSTKDPTKNIVVHTSEGKDALTNVKLIKSRNIHKQTISILELEPKTGRMHQLRLQLAHENTPILGDKKYTNKSAQKLSMFLGIERQLLHAYKIKFELDNKKYQAIAKIPKDISEYLPS